MAVPLPDVGARKCFDRYGPTGINISEQLTLDLIVHRGTEESRIKIALPESAGWWRVK